MTPMRRSVLTALVVVGLMASCSSSGPYGKAHAGDKLPESVRNKATHVTYCNGTHMDIYRPDETRGPAPAVLYAHPGGWMIGDKSEGSYVDQLVPALVSRGFVVATVGYRLGTQAPWPAQIRDVACAVRFLRAKHAKYGLDPKHIGAWGGSAGAQLVSLVGTMDRSAGFDVGPYLGQSSRLQAVVDMYGPVDVPAFVTQYDGNHDMERVFGPVMATDPTALQKASPVYWASSNDPPFLILQGKQDPIVRPQQSIAFAHGLEAAGVPVTLVLVKNGTHGLRDKGLDPSRNDLIRMTIEFFERQLSPTR
jgi:acetyl esterase/lipase